MKLYYIFVYLTFLLSTQRSRSERIPSELFSSEVTVCSTDKCRRAAEMLRENINYRKHPCDDFYSFACGRFFHGDLLEQRFRRSYELGGKILDVLTSNNDRNINAIAKIQHIFRLCSDEDAIEKFGGKVIQLQLNNVGLPSMPPFHSSTNIPNNFGRILAKIHKDAAIPFLFSLNVDKDPKNHKINRLFIQLDLFTITYSEEERFTHEELNYQKTDKYLKKYMKGVVKNLYQTEEMNISDEILELISGRVDEVVQFLVSAEKVLKKNFYFQKENELITVQKLQEKTDKILHNTNIKFDWQEYLLQLFENISDNVEDYFDSEEPLIVNKMMYLESIFELISSIDAEVLNASLWWVTVNDVTNIATKELRTLEEKFIQKTFGFIKSRGSYCLEFAGDRYSYAFTHLLLQEENVISTKYEIHEMNENIKNSFIEIIQNASWMDKSTREEALRKLHNVEMLFSHDSWVEKVQKIEEKYSQVKLEYSWYETRLKENVRSVEEKLKLLFVRNEGNKRKFPIDPLKIYTEYIYSENMVVIPFGALGLPYFNFGLHSMDYGGLGYDLGFDFTLAFSKSGRKIDSRGIERNWWKESTLREFNERTKCFVDFYRKFKINGTEIKIDEHLTLDVIISDNVAMKLALSAYEKYVQNYSEDASLIGFQFYSSEQLLTLAMASTMCSKIPLNYDERNENEVRSLYQLRVNGIFMNSNKMAQIWACPEGSLMNPGNKCNIW